MLAAKKGDKVKVHYVGTLDDGTVFDKSEEPLEFELGHGDLIPGFENAVLGMKQDDEKTIYLEPADAYGQPNDQLVKTVPRTALPPGEPKPGMVLLVKAPDGKQFPARIVSVTDKDVTMDLNHPLAGKALNFKITVVSIS